MDRAAQDRRGGQGQPRHIRFCLQVLAGEVRQGKRAGRIFCQRVSEGKKDHTQSIDRLQCDSVAEEEKGRSRKVLLWWRDAGNESMRLYQEVQERGE